jgi:RNA polymerase sigma factor (sigma-70 family)
VPATSATDRAQFSALFARHYPAVWRFVARRAWPDAVDDVVAETFLAAWRRYDDLPSDALPWLLNAAGKCLANHRRAATRAEALTERLAQSAPMRADATTQSFERTALVQAFASLTHTERALLMLTDWDDLPRRPPTAVAGCKPCSRRLGPADCGVAASDCFS